MKKKIGKIIYIVIAAFTVFLMVKALLQSSNDALDKISAVLLETDTVDPANDGKLIMISGPIEINISADEAEAPSDDPLDLDLPQAVLLEREVYQLRWVDESKDTNKPMESEILYKSSPRNDGVKARWKIAQSSFDKTIITKKETYTNKSCELKDALQVRKAYVQGLEIDAAKLVTPEFKECYESVQQYNGTAMLSVGEAHYNAEEGCFLTGKEIGDYRIIYRYLDIRSAGTVTIVGRQQGNRLEEYADGNVFVYDIVKGELTKEAYLQKLKEDYGMAKTGVVVAGILLIIIGLFVFRDQLPVKKLQLKS